MNNCYNCSLRTAIGGCHLHDLVVQYAFEADLDSSFNFVCDNWKEERNK